ncbi:DUF6611 family protein [Rathayibacter sp. AY1C2]|uniref:DUF6611 family protein n=1 Tax=Rathayibacter sp. AY1C2 TaxID=2080535 RepID=UPI0011B06BC9|nr:DUF6611 family protein [Rathayibacter sp. AY1C2]
MHLLLRLLDAGPRWGRHTVGASRYGVVRSELVVFAPGTSVEERRWLRLHAAGPQLVVAVTAAGAVGTLALDRLPLLLLAALALPTASLLLLSARRLRRACARRLVIADVDSPAVAEQAAIAAVLRRADRLLDAGVLTPLEHEEVWACAHDRVAGRVADRRSQPRAGGSGTSATDGSTS